MYVYKFLPGVKSSKADIVFPYVLIEEGISSLSGEFCMLKKKTGGGEFPWKNMVGRGWVELGLYKGR